MSRFSDPNAQFAGKAVCGDPENVHGIVMGYNRTPGEVTDLPGSLQPSQQSFHPKIDGYGNYAASMNTTLRLMGL
ncbi:MAG: hypothetical protein ACR2K2_12020 [Mycobacteriales bacterium]